MIWVGALNFVSCIIGNFCSNVYDGIKITQEFERVPSVLQIHRFRWFTIVLVFY
jgi:hypothetical protein